MASFEMSVSARRAAGAAHLTDDQVRALRAVLESERQAQVAHIARYEASLAEQGRALDDLPERELTEAVLARAREEVDEIERALARIHAGTYGRCEVCAAGIPYPRLEAIPGARRCVACGDGRGLVS